MKGGKSGKMSFENRNNKENEFQCEKIREKNFKEGDIQRFWFCVLKEKKYGEEFLKREILTEVKF